MLDDDSPIGIANYTASGRAVLSSLEHNLASAGRSFDDVDSWLDFGCGYGRVLRFLLEHVTAEKVWVTDINRDAVDFCGREFGVHGIYATSDIRANPLRSYDAIYAISVITHLDQQDGIAMLDVLGNSVRPGGLLFFTTHGIDSLLHIETYRGGWSSHRRAIEADIDMRGFAFRPYSYSPDAKLGMSWHSKEYLLARMHELHGSGMELIDFSPGGLYGYQDVFAFQRRW